MYVEGRPLNKTEAQLYDTMKAGGWHITKRGWPDFLCYKDGRLVVIEVKPKRSHKLKREQLAVMLILKQKGVECYRWTPAGFEPVTRTIDSLEEPDDKNHYYKPNEQVLSQRRVKRRTELKETQPAISKSLGIRVDK